MPEGLDSPPDRMNELKVGLRLERILMGAKLRIVGSHIADVLEAYGKPEIAMSSPYSITVCPQELWEQSGGDDTADDDATLVED